MNIMKSLRNYGKKGYGYIIKGSKIQHSRKTQEIPCFVDDDGKHVKNEGHVWKEGGMVWRHALGYKYVGSKFIYHQK